MAYTKRIIQGAGFILVSTYLGAIFGYFLRLVLTRSLSVEEYGLTYSVISLFGLFSIFVDLGIGRALAKFIPEFLVTNNSKKIKDYFLSFLIVKLSVAISIGLLFILFSNFIAANVIDESGAGSLIVLYAIFFMLKPVITLIWDAFRGFHRMGYYAIADLSLSFLLFVFSLIFIYFGHGIFSLFYAYISYGVLAVIILLIVFTKVVFPEFNKYKFQFTITKKAIKFSLSLTVAGVFGTLFGNIDTIILTKFTTLTQVAYFQAVYPLIKAFWGFGGIFTLALMPIVSEMWAKKHFQKFNKEINRLYTYVLVLSFPLVITLFVFARQILVVLYTEEYVLATVSLQILCLTIVIKIITKLNSSILAGIGKPEEMIKFIVGGSVINVIMNLWLVPKMGSKGAAISMLVSFFLIFVFSIYTLKKYLKINLKNSNYLKIAFSSLIYLGLAIVISNFYSQNLLIFSVLVGLSLIIYVLLLFVTKTIKIKEIKDLIGVLRKQK